MAKRKAKKAAPVGKRTDDAAAALRQALAGRKKDELVDALLELAQTDRKMCNCYATAPGNNSRFAGFFDLPQFHIIVDGSAARRARQGSL